jgi:hypothetical protein
VTPKAFFATAVTDEELASSNLLIVGLPSQLPVVGQMNDVLPVPFAEGSDVAQERNMQVIFRIPPDASVGYVELLPSPWNADNTVLAALGSTSQGVIWSGAALVDPTLRSQLSGNFAAITDQQVVTADTRLSTIPQDSGIAPIVPFPVEPSAPVEQPSWILPAAGIAGGLAVLILLIVLIRSWALNRKHPKKGE